LANWIEVPRHDVKKRSPRHCFSCEKAFPKLAALPPPSTVAATGDLATKKTGNAPVPGVKAVPSISSTGRYACSDCGKWFCVDCDIFCHEEVYNCAGCEADPEGKEKRQREKEAQAQKTATHSAPNHVAQGDVMEIDG